MRDGFSYLALPASHLMNSNFLAITFNRGDIGFVVIFFDTCRKNRHPWGIIKGEIEMHFATLSVKEM